MNELIGNERIKKNEQLIDIYASSKWYKKSKHRKKIIIQEMNKWKNTINTFINKSNLWKKMDEDILWRNLKIVKQRRTYEKGKKIEYSKNKNKLTIVVQ